MGRVKMPLLWAVLFVSAIILIGCGSSDNADADTQWKSYSTDAYEFNYPSSWEITEPEKMGLEARSSTEFIIYAPVDETKDFAANVNLAIQKFPLLAPSAKEQADSASAFFELLGSSSGIKDFKQIDFIPLKIGNVEAGMLTSEYIISQNNIGVKCQQLIIPQGPQSYILTATCAKDDWETYEADFQKIIASFRLK